MLPPRCFGSAGETHFGHDRQRGRCRRETTGVRVRVVGEGHLAVALAHTGLERRRRGTEAGAAAATAEREDRRVERAAATAAEETATAATRAVAVGRRTAVAALACATRRRVDAPGRAGLGLRPRPATCGALADLALFAPAGATVGTVRRAVATAAPARDEQRGRLAAHFGRTAATTTGRRTGQPGRVATGATAVEATGAARDRVAYVTVTTRAADEHPQRLA